MNENILMTQLISHEFSIVHSSSQLICTEMKAGLILIATSKSSKWILRRTGPAIAHEDHSENPIRNKIV